jgi:hypothetical protein
VRPPRTASRSGGRAQAHLDGPGFFRLRSGK